MHDVTRDDLLAIQRELGRLGYRIGLTLTREHALAQLADHPMTGPAECATGHLPPEEVTMPEGDSFRVHHDDITGAVTVILRVRPPATVS